MNSQMQAPSKDTYLRVPGVRPSKLPVVTGRVKPFWFPFKMWVLKVLKIMQFSAKETKRTSLEVRTHISFLHTDFDFKMWLWAR